MILERPGIATFEYNKAIQKKYIKLKVLHRLKCKRTIKTHMYHFTIRPH
uniref:Uncharacterized protein n=1 Tax=Cyprinus carpio carpio TaxID=630221 RepID=A0A8C1D1S6_CYPCA